MDDYTIETDKGTYVCRFGHETKDSICWICERNAEMFDDMEW
jgi:hypothetical protein